MLLSVNTSLYLKEISCGAEQVIFVFILLPPLREEVILTTHKVSEFISDLFKTLWKGAFSSFLCHRGLPGSATGFIQSTDSQHAPV